MKINDISKKIKELRLKKGYSLEDVAQLVPVSKQGYHLWEQGLRAWKPETLAILSKILGFRLSIENGIMEISECVSQINKREVDIMMKDTKLKGYEIIKLYTGADNINFDDNEILETVLVYSDKEEAMDVFNTDSLIPIYALYNNESGNIHPNTYGLDKTRAYSMYYWNYADILDDDNTVYIDTVKNIKVSKAYVKIDLDNINPDGTYPVLSISNKESDKTIGMFSITDIYGLDIPQMDRVSTDFPNIID